MYVCGDLLLRHILKIGLCLYQDDKMDVDSANAIATYVAEVMGDVSEADVLRLLLAPTVERLAMHYRTVSSLSVLATGR
jgi:hypothetical protein